jgi:hypothetical protein
LALSPKNSGATEAVWQPRSISNLRNHSQMNQPFVTAAGKNSLPQTSNLDCLPGRAGGTLNALVGSRDYRFGPVLHLSAISDFLFTRPREIDTKMRLEPCLEHRFYRSES